jgi:hypothetical protein
VKSLPGRQGRDERVKKTDTVSGQPIALFPVFSLPVALGALTLFAMKDPV